MCIYLCTVRQTDCHKGTTTNERNNMNIVKFYHFDQHDELYLGVAQIKVERTSGGAIEYDIVFDCVRNTETHESIFPDQFGFPREFREALIASAIDADQCAQTEARAEKYWAEYDAEEKSMTVSCHTVFLKKGEPAKTIIVYETRGRVVRYRLIDDAPNAPMRYADELPEPIIEYLNWVASGCPSTQPAQLEI